MPALLQGTHKFCVISRCALVAYGRTQQLLISVQPAQPLHVHVGLAEPVIVSHRKRISAGCCPSASVARWRCSMVNWVSHARDAGHLKVYSALPPRRRCKSSGSREPSSAEWWLYFHSGSAIFKRAPSGTKRPLSPYPSTGLLPLSPPRIRSRYIESMNLWFEPYLDSFAFGASGPSHPYRATLASTKGYLVEHSLRQTV